ncbi:MAG TPA: DNA repair protein RecN [Anaerolineales bacterium]|nr:DNA repair protein RecN [Anaerolineales bacterium]
MLVELRIENFAIIDRLELQFKPGLITFTGETGAGKSIIIDAVETLLGGKADQTMIRVGADRASIEATFRISQEIGQEIQALLEKEELSEDPEYLTLNREIRSGGRSIARINGRAANLGLVRELGEYLLDVHGQSEHLSLLRVREHLGLLDRYAGCDDLFEAYRACYQQWNTVRHELKELRLLESEAARRIDLLNFQINEIESARLQLGEEEELKSERTRLANAENLASLAQQSLTILEDEDPETPSVSELLGRVVGALSSLARIDPSQASLSDNAQGILTSLTDISVELRAYLEGIEYNPKRLDQVEERLGLIHNLKRKYGDSIEAIREFGEKARQQLETITRAGERIADLELQEKDLLIELGRRGQALSKTRHSAAGKLKREIEGELTDLNMSGAQFDVDFVQQESLDGAPLEDGRRVVFDSTGLERVEFLIAPNPGEGLKPLVKIASGGETSRLMLALKNVLARADHVPTLIFDEIDQGIGGRVGTIVGYKLWRLARHHQVLCVTHLPQLAAFGEQHYQVQKQVEDGRTHTQVKDLLPEDRVPELAMMLGETSDGTLQSAREMLANAREYTSNKEA